MVNEILPLKTKAGADVSAPAQKADEGEPCLDQARSKRSAFITLFQAATKSSTNFARQSSWA